MSSEQVNLLNVNAQAKTVPMVSIREIACYLSMLEGGKVEDKLECKDSETLISPLSSPLVLNH